MLIDDLSVIDVRALRKSPNKCYAAVVHRLYKLCLVTKFLVANAGLFWTGELEPFIFGTVTTNHRASTALPLAP